MNRYDERYEIRLARREDIESIMQFINDYWREGHILSRNRALFEYEYLDEDGVTVNMILAIDRGTELLEGLFGFLKCSAGRWIDKKDIWGSLWYVNPSHNNIPLLGIELAKRVYELTGCRYQIGNGANPSTTVPLRKLYFGEKTAKMIQYYCLNPDKNKFAIPVIHHRWHPQYKDESTRTYMEQYSSIDEVTKKYDIEKLDVIPYKDNWYLNKRYFKHPWYHYQVYGLYTEIDPAVKALMVGREVKCNGAKVLRIVDYLGEQNLFSGLAYEFRNLMRENDYEYIDFYVYGFNEEIIRNAGFCRREDNDENIIPNYFEPFLQKNVDIWVHYKEEGTMFFKADGDQDRPNICPQELDESRGKMV